MSCGWNEWGHDLWFIGRAYLWSSWILPQFITLLVSWSLHCLPLWYFMQQVPQFLLEEAELQGSGVEVHIVVTQPRRIAAIRLLSLDSYFGVVNFGNGLTWVEADTLFYWCGETLQCCRACGLGAWRNFGKKCGLCYPPWEFSTKGSRKHPLLHNWDIIAFTTGIMDGVDGYSYLLFTWEASELRRLRCMRAQPQKCRCKYVLVSVDRFLMSWRWLLKLCVLGSFHEVDVKFPKQQHKS